MKLFRSGKRFMPDCFIYNSFYLYRPSFFSRHSPSSCDMLTLLLFWWLLGHRCWLPVSHSSLLATTCVPHSGFFLGVVLLLVMLTRLWQLSSSTSFLTLILLLSALMGSASVTLLALLSCIGVFLRSFSSGGGFLGVGGSSFFGSFSSLSWLMISLTLLQFESRFMLFC